MTLTSCGSGFTSKLRCGTLPVPKAVVREHYHIGDNQRMREANIELSQTLHERTYASILQANCRSE